MSYLRLQSFHENGGSDQYIGHTYFDFPLAINIYCPVLPALTRGKLLLRLIKLLKHTYNKSYPKMIYLQVKTDK